MELLASVDMHGIQTSGNCIRNITSDERAGIAVDEIEDPRPYCEILRQWSTLHPEFAFLPRKFKIAVNGAREDRAATAWHDVGLQLLRNDEGAIGFKVLVGGGMGRTPVIARTIRDFLPWAESAELHRSGGAGLQPLGPARQHVQGAHQDPGQGRRRTLHARGGGGIPPDRRSRRRAPHHQPSGVRPGRGIVRRTCTGADRRSTSRRRRQTH